MNAYQKLYGLSLRTSGATKSMINKASLLYDSVSYSTLTQILDCFADQSKVIMLSWRNETVIHCGDNLDYRSSKRHESGGTSFHQVHLYNNMLYKSRINVDGLDRNEPSVNLQDMDYSQFLLNKEEEEILLQNMAYHIADSWKATVSDTISLQQPSHAYPDEATRVTEKVKIISVKCVLTIYSIYF